MKDIKVKECYNSVQSFVFFGMPQLTNCAVSKLIIRFFIVI